MRSNPADYELVTPGTLQAVLALLAAEPGAWTPMAGGTELMVQFNSGRLAARRLVSIAGLPELTAIDVSDDAITIGAGVTYTALRRHPRLAAQLPLVAAAASWTGSVANQNRGTLGGNLVNGSPAADSAPALLAYGAELELISVRGVRRVPYDAFHTGYKRNVLAPDELLRAIHVPVPAPGTRGYLRKVGPRNAQAISKIALGATALLHEGRIESARIGLASVAEMPFRCRATEAVLHGRVPDTSLLRDARAALLREIRPLDDIRSTARYREIVAANLLGEWLQQLAAPGPERMGDGPNAPDGVSCL